MKVYSRHNCERQHRTARTFVKCAIRNAAWISGDADYAVIAWCSVPTITLHETEAKARETLNWLRKENNGACGGRCQYRHDLVLINWKKN